MELRVCNGEALAVPEITEVKAEEFSVTYLLQNPVTPDALRLEFNARRVELYEIEIFE